MADSRQDPQPEISSPDSNSARSKVFKTTKLLETVLAHLPARDLLMCECINRTWHAVIKKSDTLQEKLFYKCDLVTLSEDMDESDLEINPIFLLVQRRWSFGYWRGEGANGFESLDYPEASWKKMYLSRPAICKIGIQKVTPDRSTAGSLVQFIQHDTIKMNHLVGSSPTWPFKVVRLSQSDGIRMHHLLGWDLSQVFFLTLNGDTLMHLINFGHDVPKGCPETSLKQFHEMYVGRRESQISSDDVPVDLICQTAALGYLLEHFGEHADR